MKRHLTLALTAFCLLYSSLSYTQGIGIIDGVEGAYLKVMETKTTVTVTNQIAVVKGTHVFKNTTGAPVNIKYGFPLNESANAIELKWFADGVWKMADVGSSAQDNEVPSGSGQGGGQIDPDLKAYLGDFPLFFSPSDTIDNDSVLIVEVTYVELLSYYLGKVNFWLNNDYSALQGEPVLKQTFDFNLTSEREILTIDLLNLNSMDDLNANTAAINFEAEEALADFSYNLEYELTSDGLGLSSISTVIPDSLFNCDSLGNGYVSFILEPESNVNSEIIEKNFTLIIDRSGSMSGDKIVQAKDAATFIVQNLNPGDHFNIVDFSTDVNSLFSEHVIYNVTNENLALEYIDNINADGGTNISDALVTSIEQFNVIDPNKANIIIFFTDGVATQGTTSTSGILSGVNMAIEENETSIFLFTFGIGEDVDRALLTLLAQDNSGLATFVDNENIEEDITNFFLSINNPVLLNTEITFSPDIIDEIYPFPYPNLYKGQQLILSGRYTEPQMVNVHIEGQAFNFPVSYDFEVALADTNDIAKSFLPKIWSKQKIDALQLQFYLAESEMEADAIEMEIDSISRCFGVVSTAFTSFEDNIVEVNELVIHNADFEIKINPNPFTDHLNIYFPNYDFKQERVVVELLNAQSKRIFYIEKELFGTDQSLEINGLNDLAPGIYFCRIIITGKSFLIKVSKVD